MGRGVDVCVSIDAETRGMHVQQPDPNGPIVIVGATGDAAVRRSPPQPQPITTSTTTTSTITTFSTTNPSTPLYIYIYNCHPFRPNGVDLGSSL